MTANTLNQITIQAYNELQEKCERLEEENNTYVGANETLGKIAINKGKEIKGLQEQLTQLQAQSSDYKRTIQKQETIINSVKLVVGREV